MPEQTAASTMSNPTVDNSDPYKFLNLASNPDGTITRLTKFPSSPATCDPNLPTPFFTKDVPINQSNNTWVRIFLPRHLLDHSSATPPPKLPLVVYFHGGGFIQLSAASTIMDDFYVNLATQVPVIIASVEYRLAPEHRLPAAYEDAVEALHFIETAPDHWLRDYADLWNCYLMGSSAGGNIAYHAGLRAAAEADDFHRLKIRGLILHQPFFNGAQRSRSESRLENNPTLPLSSSDLMWELSLPVGVDRDHEYSNPMVGDGLSERLDQLKAAGFRVLVAGSDGDLLIDRQMEVAKMLKENGVEVVEHFVEGGYHGVVDKDLFAVVKSFTSSS
ncbi:carboxylesterase 1-like [Pyrus ussuriensis x Pyrus communis]|uniref:Carboxylesterase 1-like n=1 Tax=Pyrus ussuriensis x Pyrus communis TaxID=2448454 RepID=A0A5N5I1Y0_9ROSA|nr:carboxylesterase 1-like [Pyrus ussuriensis x Pyrus communis]